MINIGMSEHPYEGDAIGLGLNIVQSLLFLCACFLLVNILPTSSVKTLVQLIILAVVVVEVEYFCLWFAFEKE